MKKPAVILAAVLVLTACRGTTGDDGIQAGKTPLVSGINVQHMDTAVRPGNDFFAYVNGAWLEETEIPADRSSYGVSAILRDQAQAQVRAIIEESADGDFPQGSDEQKVGDLYRSYMDRETRNSLGVAPLLPELERIAGIANYDDLAVYFAETAKRGLDAPFSLAQYADLKNPSRYMMYTWQSGLGLPDREYYLLDDEKSKKLREQYREHIERMFGLAGFPNGPEAASTVLDLETRLAREQLKKEETRNLVALYRKVPLDALDEIMPRFNWTAYLAEAGLTELDGLVVMMRDYMRALDDIIVSTDLETWKTYLSWSALNATATRLDEALDRQNFEFYGRTLSGTPEQRPMWRRAVNAVNGTLGEVVGKEYVRRHFSPEAKERMLELVGNLIRAYEVSIKELDWMSDETKAQALDKLSKFTPKIAYPDQWRDYSALEIRPDDLYGNLERAALVEYRRLLDRQGGPVDRSEWRMTPQTVNAYYSPALNEIVFPAAILQPPIFNLAADDAVNYGAIGSIIGHEIGHGFDDKGSTFDGDGIMRNWWTEADRKEFEKRTARLVDQYSDFRPFDDLAVNGEFTLGENIGDLGGISISLLAYQLSLNGAEAAIIDGFTGTQRVFLGYAQAWRRKAREEAVRQQIATDPHSPNEYRTNGAVRNVPEFYEAFDVAETDALYLPPDDRVKIW